MLPILKRVTSDQLLTVAFGIYIILAVINLSYEIRINRKKMNISES